MAEKDPLGFLDEPTPDVYLEARPQPGGTAEAPAEAPTTALGALPGYPGGGYPAGGATGTWEGGMELLAGKTGVPVEELEARAKAYGPGVTPQEMYRMVLPPATPLEQVKIGGKLLLDWYTGKMGGMAARALGKAIPSVSFLSRPATAAAIPGAADIGYQKAWDWQKPIDWLQTGLTALGGGMQEVPWMAKTLVEAKQTADPWRHKQLTTAREAKIRDLDIESQRINAQREFERQVDMERINRERQAAYQEQLESGEFRMTEQQQRAVAGQEQRLDLASEGLKRQGTEIVTKPPKSSFLYKRADVLGTGEASVSPTVEALESQFKDRGIGENHPVRKFLREVIYEAVPQPGGEVYYNRRAITPRQMDQAMRDVLRLARTYPDEAKQLWSAMAEDLGTTEAGKVYRQAATEFKAEAGREQALEMIVKAGPLKQRLNPKTVSSEWAKNARDLEWKLPPDEYEALKTWAEDVQTTIRKKAIPKRAAEKVAEPEKYIAEPITKHWPEYPPEVGYDPITGKTLGGAVGIGTAWWMLGPKTALTAAALGLLPRLGRAGKAVQFRLPEEYGGQLYPMGREPGVAAVRPERVIRPGTLPVAGQVAPAVEPLLPPPLGTMKPRRRREEEITYPSG
jgi:hypothetical protein